MKNYIKAFLATGIGMVMMKIIAEPENNAVSEKMRNNLIFCGF